MAPDRIVDRYDYREAKLFILRPIIDKLVFEYNFSDCGSHKRKIQEIVLKAAKKAIKKKGIAFQEATEKNVGGKRLYYLNKHYLHNFVLLYKPTGAKIIIQIKAKKRLAFLRCELNPARLGNGGMTFFRSFLNGILANDLKDISFDTIAKKAKSIKRIDIAVDMLGVDASDLEGRYVYKDKKLKKEPIQNDTGRTETMYFQMPENDKNEAYWYNKKQEIKDNAKDPIDGGQQSPYGKALSPKPKHLQFIVTAARTWLSAYPDDSVFWIDHAIGRRVCALFETLLSQAVPALPEDMALKKEAGDILADLVRIGVAEAHRLEEVLINL